MKQTKVKTIIINDNAKIQIRHLETNSNYTKGVRLLINNVVVLGNIEHYNRNEQDIKENCIQWMQRKENDTLLQSLLNS